MRTTTVALCLVLAALAIPAEAQVTQYINYQGRLIDGTNLVNDTVSLVLRVYDGATAGTLLCEDSNDVAVVDGLYATFIGDNITEGSLGAIAASADAFVEVEVNGTRLEPRERVGWVAYALNADRVGNMAASSFATGAPLYVYTETDPVWSSASNAYLPKGEGDERYVNSDGDLVTGNVDAAGGLGVRGNVIVDGLFSSLRLASRTNATSDSVINRPQGLFLDESYAYGAGVQVGERFAIYNISDPSNMVRLSMIDLSGEAGGRDLKVEDGFAYTHGDFGFVIISVTNVAAPYVVAYRDSIGSYDVEGDLLYAASGGQLVVYDISDRLNWVGLSTTVVAQVANVLVSGRTAYVGASNALHAFDVSNPAGPTLRSSITTTNIGQLWLDGNRLYSLKKRVVPTSTALSIYDVTDSSNMRTLLAHAPVSGYYEWICADGPCVYLAGDALKVYDVTDPAAPELLWDQNVTESYNIGGIFKQGYHLFTFSYFNNMLNAIETKAEAGDGYVMARGFRGDGSGLENVTASYYAETDPVWAGASNGIQSQISNNESLISNLATAKVSKAGDTMTGALTNEVSVTAARFYNPNNAAAGADALAIGGSNNEAAGDNSAVGGGNFNRIGQNASEAFIGGGSDNLATGIQSMIVGGYGNIAGGQKSFAAGTRAHAHNRGAFVWADSQNADFPSVANDEFAIRAAGGLRLVDGAFTGDGAGLTNLPAGSYTETDPVWAAEKSGYATGTPLYAFAETDPVWAGASNDIQSQISNNQSLISNLDTAKVSKTGDTMSGTLNMGGKDIAAVSLLGFNGSFVQVGNGATGELFGVGVGPLANGSEYGVAVGSSAIGSSWGAAVGGLANGGTNGAAMGYQSDGSAWGAAHGFQATAKRYGAALGYHANGTDSGVAVGQFAAGQGTNIAIGACAGAGPGAERIAIGHNVTNLVNDSAAIRGTLYLDGGTGVYHRTTFGSGAWVSLLDGVATGTPLYAFTETDPVWAAEKSGYATGAPVYVETDPVWAAEKSGYATGTPLYAFTETDPVWAGASNDIQSQISNLDTAKVSKTGDTMTGALNMSGQTLTNVGRIDFSVDGIAVGRDANAPSGAVAVGHEANGRTSGASVGYRANSRDYGAAIGYIANAVSYGAAVGHNANGMDYGVAVGYDANARTHGAVLGVQANGMTYGSAVGQSANGYDYGTALGVQAHGINSGVAVGYQSLGSQNGVAVGHGAYAAHTNIAIGMAAHSGLTGRRIAIGAQLTNDINDSAAIRGTLYLDGGTGVLYRSTFGGGTWVNLLDGVATGTPLYAYTETDPVWAAEKAGYATGTPLYVETDPNAVLADGTRAMTGDLDMGGFSITNVADGSIVFEDGTAIASADVQNWNTGKLEKTEWQAADSTTNYVRRTGDTMTGALTVQTNVILSYSANRGWGARSMLTIAGGNDVEIGNGANSYDAGTAVGQAANGCGGGAAIGLLANGWYSGAAVGYHACGDHNGAAIGYYARGATNGAAVGSSANGDYYGAAVGANANGNNFGAAVGYFANGLGEGAAMGHMANGYGYGAAIGYYANAGSHGAVVGHRAQGAGYGAGVGYGANALQHGAVVGGAANGYDCGVAVGYMATGRLYGVAVGSWANGYSYGATIGSRADGSREGVAVGYYANGAQTNVAIGYKANAAAGINRIALGQNVTNAADNSAAIRGTLYLDGGTGVYYRSTFGSGAWVSLLDGVATGTPLYAYTETDPMWAAEKAGYATGTPVYAETDPVWTAAEGDYLKDDGSRAMTGDLDMGGFSITNVADGSIVFEDGTAIASADVQNWNTGRLEKTEWQAADSTTNYVRRTGDTMTGALTINAGVDQRIVIGSSGTDIAIGNAANGDGGGVAVGQEADGSDFGAAVGAYADGSGYGAVLGYSVYGSDHGAAVGNDANAFTYGAALGDVSYGYQYGAAVGASTRAHYYGVALGYQANGQRGGVAVGAGARGTYSNIAIGVQANADGGTNRIAIGVAVAPEFDNSITVRGDLYLDGGRTVYYRQNFGMGAFSDILTGYVQEFELTALSNNLVTSDFATNYVRRTGDTMTGALTINASSGLVIGSASNNVAIGRAANAGDQGVAIGGSATGLTTSVAIGNLARASGGGAAVGIQANARDYGAALGSSANAYNYGVAIGQAASGSRGVAVGLNSVGGNFGAAMGESADGSTYGAVVGRTANGSSQGAVVGASANGSSYGAALGYSAQAYNNGIAAGWGAGGWNGGVGIGYLANGIHTNIAIGYQANAGGATATNRIAIGRDVTNTNNNSAVIRGSLYLDGATGVQYRPTFGSGAWTDLTGAFLPLDGSRAMTGDLDMGDHSITNVKTNTIVFTDGSHAVRSSGDTMTGMLTINDAIVVGSNTSAAVAGMIRFNPATTNFEGYTGTEWISLTARYAP